MQVENSDDMESIKNSSRNNVYGERNGYKSYDMNIRLTMLESPSAL